MPAWARGALQRLCAAEDGGFSLGHHSTWSLGRGYGRDFLPQAFLRHPLRALGGLIQCRTRAQRWSRKQGVTYLLSGPEDAFLWMTTQVGLLIVMGYCQKPTGDQIPCPAGRFSHECRYLDQLQASANGLEPTDTACRECALVPLGTRALRAGASIYIMTSAKDVTGDVLWPALENGQFHRAIFFACPFSTSSLVLPMMISRVNGYLVEFAGDCCRDHREWRCAERGDKPSRTHVPKEALRRVVDLLDFVAAERQRKGSPANQRFVRERNIYLPATSRP